MAGAAWWQSAVIYQVLVRSFQDSGGDGQGDLPGLIERLGYLQSLGVDAIWLSPIYASPWADCGYDACDFEQIHPQYGTLADFDRLVAEAHRRNLKIILDWVPNHTSDEHAWFRESRASRDNPRRSWYLWADPAIGGGPPNNWRSVFGGSAWTLDERTGQYYFHAFLPQQPDLNWRNRAVRRAMCDNLRYWAARGVDGFRVDAADMLMEDVNLRPNPPNPGYQTTDAPDNKVIQKHTRNHPGNHRAMAIIRRTVDSLPGCVLLGEMYLPVEKLVEYYGTLRRPELHLPLNLQLLHPKWEADSIQQILERYYAIMPPHGWPALSLGNHDIRRLASRAPGAQARVAAMLLLTVRGTPTLYYGDEIGMRDVSVPDNLADDPQRFSWPGHSRDPARSPMQWNAEPLADFTTGRPWLPLGQTQGGISVAAQERDPKSLLSLYRRLLEFRRSHPALVIGDFQPLPRNKPLVAFSRQHDRQRLLVLLNTNHEPAVSELTEPYRLLLSTALDRPEQQIERTLRLRGDEGVILMGKT